MHFIFYVKNFNIPSMLFDNFLKTIIIWAQLPVGEETTEEKQVGYDHFVFGWTLHLFYIFFFMDPSQSLHNS